MKKSPLVSIVIPCYNHQNYVQECIQSVIDQDYQNIELIIIDDGSSDNSVQKIEEMIYACQQRFIRFEFRHRANKGLCATLNEALQWCEGEYYSAIASDDIMFDCKTSTQIKIIEEKKIIYTNLVGVLTKLSLIGDTEKQFNTPFKKNYTISGFEEFFLQETALTTPSLLLNREKVINAGGYDESLAVEDVDLILKITHAGGEVLSINKPLVYYRRHNNNLSNQKDHVLNEVFNTLKKYSKHALYNKACSKAFMVRAHSEKEKLIRWKFMIKALKKYPKNIFSISFLKFIIKMIIK